MKSVLVLVLEGLALPLVLILVLEGLVLVLVLVLVGLVLVLVLGSSVLVNITAFNQLSNSSNIAAVGDTTDLDPVSMKKATSRKIVAFLINLILFAVKCVRKEKAKYFN